MNITELSKECPDLNITVRAADLREMVLLCVSETKRQLEQKLMDEMEEKYLSPQKTAELLDCDLSTLWRWNKRNYLKPISIGGKKRYKKSDIDKILMKGVSA